MLTVSLLAACCAVVVWPDATSVSRLRVLSGGRSRLRRRPARWWAALALPTAAVLGAALALLGVGGVVAVALLGVAAMVLRRSRVRARTRLDAMAATAEALRAMVSELRAGAHPAVAAESAAAEAPRQAADVLRALAGAARLGGDLTVPDGAAADGVPARLAGAWELAQRHGLPLAEVLDAVRHDLDATTRLARQADARMAGPRASAAVLALLPGFGIALGEAMGAAPLRVLAGTPAGQLLLVVGTGLICAGVAWTTRLTSQVVAR